MFRIGIGQDSHQFDNSLGLTFGGAKFNNYPKLKGDSDADVILHSLCNALSSAVGGESLGSWSDSMCQKGITDSKEYIKYILNIVSQNFTINNISIAVEAQKPRLTSEEKRKVKMTLSNILKINLNQIGITYTSGDHLTSFGRGEGIQVFSTVLLQEK